MKLLNNITRKHHSSPNSKLDFKFETLSIRRLPGWQVTFSINNNDTACNDSKPSYFFIIRTNHLSIKHARIGKLLKNLYIDGPYN